MGLGFLRLQWLCLSFLFLFLVSCSANLGLNKLKGEKDFFQETIRLEKLAHGDNPPSVQAESHLRLALLYVNSRNPQLNYSRALQEVESYLSMSPAEAQRDDVQNWFAVLKELDRVRKEKRVMEGKKQGFQTQIDKLRISLKKIQEENSNLADEVANLQEIIEKLKNLDWQMEEKRNLVK